MDWNAIIFAVALPAAFRLWRHRSGRLRSTTAEVVSRAAQRVIGAMRASTAVLMHLPGRHWSAMEVCDITSSPPDRMAFT
jgi:hypothetical protein